MRNLDHFRSCLDSALDRRYFVDKWIRDQSLASIFEQNYDMDFMSKIISINTLMLFILRNINSTARSSTRSKIVKMSLRELHFITSPRLHPSLPIFLQKMIGKKFITTFVFSDA